MIRKATGNDLEAVVSLYDEIHCAEEAGLISTGWKRGIYPSRQSAMAALERDDLFVLEEGGRIIGSGIINQIQVDVYTGAPWKNDVPDDQVCVLHTLMISPSFTGKGNARKFLTFYGKMPGKSDVRNCGSIPMSSIKPQEPCIIDMDMKRSISFPLYLTVSQASTWCSWRNMFVHKIGKYILR